MPKHSTLAVVLVAAGLLSPTSAGAELAPPPNAVAPSDVVVARGRPPVPVALLVSTAGEAVLAVTAAAPGASWGEAGRESAVVSVEVDGRYASDLVVTGPRRTPRGLALGTLTAGRHTLAFRFAADRSAPRTTLARLTGLRLTVAEAGTRAEVARRHAPVLVGRALTGPFENARTDTPLLAWHEDAPGPAPGQRRLVYSTVWSNEDGGTVGPALMARWGRTTDIEWVYAVVVDAGGHRVPGTAVYQGPDHRTLPFAGTYSGDHPVLQACTSNNTLCDAVDGTMLFALPADDTRPPRRAREYLMDTHPWTYRVMAEEMLREGRVEQPSDPATPELGDQRTYLYLEVDKDTGPATAPGEAPGAAVVVHLRGDPRTYRSDHGTPSWSVARDDPAATTVELPAGTRAVDVERIDVVRIPLAAADSGATVTVTDLNRAFLLDAAWRPRPSFAEAHGLAVRLDADAPVATIWGSAA
jgi:hypothetical protein